MTSLHFVKKCRKTIRGTGIKKGDSYYWWQFAYGTKQRSKTKPRRSQLTRSGFLASIYDIEDDIAEATADEHLEDVVSNVIDELRNLSDECQSSLDNMPDALQEADTGQLLSERVENCNNAADEFESIDLDPGSKPEDESAEDYWQDKLDEVQAVTIES